MLDLYLNGADFLEDRDDPKVKDLASLTGRTANAISLRLANFRALDDSSTKGMTNYSKASQRLWDEFHGHREELAFAAEGAQERLRGDVNDSPGTSSGQGGDITTGETGGTGKTRHGQTDFRDAVRKRYDDECLLCEISDPGLLQASHILGWSDFEEYRGDPGNGLLLCYNHHRAFDLNMFTLTEDYEVVVRPKFEPSSEFLRSTVIEQIGEPLMFPNEPPSKEYLRIHNSRIPWRVP